MEVGVDSGRQINFRICARESLQCMCVHFQKLCQYLLMDEVTSQQILPIYLSGYALVPPLR